MRKLKLNIRESILISFFLLASSIYIFYKPYYEFNRYEVKTSNLYDNEMKHFSLYASKSLKIDSNCLCRPQTLEVSQLSDGVNLQVRIKDLKETYSISYNLSKMFFESSLLTCDLYNSFRRGPNQRVISYYIQNIPDKLKRDVYASQFRLLANIVKNYLPGWYIRVYHNNNLEANERCFFQCLRDSNSNEIIDLIDLCNIEQMPSGLNDKKWSLNYSHPTMWRWLPVVDNFVSVMSSRDIFSCITKRELNAVWEWILNYSQTNPFLIMRDHPDQSSNMIAGR